MTGVAGKIDFTGRVAIVTGGGNGLGRAHSLALAARGAKVVVNDLGVTELGTGSSKRAADAVVEEIRAAGGTAVANYDSVATAEGGAAIISTALEAFGQVDVLVNNAGFLTDAAFEDQTDEQISAMLDVHLKGAFHVTQPAFRAMKKAGYGRIVFTGSSSAMFGHAWHSTYAAAKAGVAGLMHVVALEGAPHNILANAIMPSAITRLTHAMKDGYTQNPVFAASMARADLEPLLPAMQPEFASPLVLYLASRDCQSSHNLYSQVGNRYARVFIGVTEGWKATDGPPPTPEEIASQWQRIEDRSVYYLPMTNYDEYAILSPSNPE